jgi:hypothetical protein
MQALFDDTQAYIYYKAKRVDSSLPKLFISFLDRDAKASLNA